MRFYAHKKDNTKHFYAHKSVIYWLLGIYREPNSALVRTDRAVTTQAIAGLEKPRQAQTHSFGRCKANGQIVFA